MPSRYYTAGQFVLANCGTRQEPEWIPGRVIEVYPLYYDGITHPYRIELERESDGKTTWNFPPSFVMADTPRNRRRHGICGK